MNLMALFLLSSVIHNAVKFIEQKDYCNYCKQSICTGSLSTQTCLTEQHLQKVALVILF